MRKMLNTLFITNPDIHLGRDGLTVVAWLDSKKIAQFPIHNFEDIVCFNYTGISSSLLQLCGEKEVSVTYLSPTGKYRGKFFGPVKGNVLLRKEQYRVSENSEDSLFYARLFILGKIYNSKRVLTRLMSDHSNKTEAEKVFSIIEKLESIKKLVLTVNSADKLLGIEGDASRAYFSVFDNLILQQKEDFIFNGRNRRPPKDPINALLSLVYGFVRVKTESALETVGLDPYVGFYHKDRPGRASLALDIMEELRAHMGDRFIVNLINKNMINKSDFLFQENGAVTLTDKGFKKFVDFWNKFCLEKFKHPFIEESIPIGLLPYVQAMLLARTIRKDLDLYPPFFMN